VFVFLRSGVTWRQAAYLKASNTDAADLFGYSVAMSEDGSTIAVGAIGEASAAKGIGGVQSDNSMMRAGAVYVFARTGDAWLQQAYVKASNTAPAMSFGSSVSLSVDTLVVGAPGESSNAEGINGTMTGTLSSSGAAYVFVRSGSTWTQQAYVKASNTFTNDVFGVAVAVRGDTLVVGAPGEPSAAVGIDGTETDTSAPSAGAAYGFLRTGTTWVQTAYLKASNTRANASFATSLSFDGLTLAVGTPGEASAGKGIGGSQTDTSASNAGAVYAFRTDGSGHWVQDAFIKASNTASGAAFGSSVAITDGVLAVGAPGESSNAKLIGGNQANTSAPGAGACYVLVRGSAWSQVAYVKASNTLTGASFGQSVAMALDTLVVGAIGETSGASSVNGNQRDDGVTNAGAAYVIR
jgi:hypothetical protein